ncbi:MAG: sugar phosphate isomerase/epimerase [Candidatus Latescibacteria bacterium]|nr:sugar phosphate isomerase/epimerase [Candidatus Latescibacterota bacterium]
MFKFSYIMVAPPKDFGPFADFERALGRLAELGYRGVEFSITHPLGFDVDALERALKATGLALPSLLTGWSYFNEGLSLCSPDPAVRDRAVQRLLGHLDVAARFNALLVVGQMQGFRSDEPDEKAANERIVDCLRRVARAAETKGVILVLEPVNHLQVGFNHTVAQALDLIRRVGSPALRPMVDTLHMNIEEKSLTDPILTAGAALTHVHLCETNGSLLGSGHLDFPAVFRALSDVRYDGFISVKIYQGASWEEGASGAMAFLKAMRLN